MVDVVETLKQREEQYGDFGDISNVAQGIKRMMRMTDGWEQLSDSQREALGQYFTKKDLLPYVK